MLEQEIADKLETTVSTLRLLRDGGPVGRAATAGLAARFRLDAGLPLGQQLAAHCMLTVDEGAWLDKVRR